MKRILNFLAVFMVVVAALSLVAVAIAGEVYDRATVTLGTTTGTANWTNTADYAALKLLRIWVEGVPVTNQVVTITRTAGGYEQTVGTVTCGTSTNGSTASFTAGYMKNGDKLGFAGSIATGGVAVVEYAVQKH